MEPRAGASPWHSALRSAKSNSLVLIGGSLVLIVVLLSALGRYVAPHDPVSINLGETLAGLGSAHLLGTDDLGRDTLSRLMYATQTELIVGILATVVAAAIGVPLGVMAGYVGGWLDRGVVFVVDTILALPAILLAMTLVGIWGPGAVNIGLSLGLVSVPTFARLSRASSMGVKQELYVTAARATGVTDLRIMVRHILPNIVGPLIVQASLLLGFAILAESGLSFLGVGIQAPEPSWGGMLRAGMDHLRDAPYLTLFPGIAIFLTVLGFSLLGDGLSDILDPKGRQR